MKLLQDDLTASLYSVSMSLFCLNHSFVYLLYFCPNWKEAGTEVKGCGFPERLWLNQK